MSESSDAEKRNRIENELSAIQGELASVTGLMEKTYALLSAGGPVEFVSGKLNELQQKQADLRQRIDAKEAEQQSLISRESTFYQSKKEIKQLVEQLQSSATDELFKLRAQIVSRLRNLVETLILAPLGDKPRLQKTIDFLRDEPDAGDVLALLEKRLSEASESRRYFALGFRNNTVRAVYPSDDDPLRYEQQVTSGSDGIDILYP